jgi:hypothetical protein
MLTQIPLHSNIFTKYNTLLMAYILIMVVTKVEIFFSLQLGAGCSMFGHCL